MMDLAQSGIYEDNILSFDEIIEILNNKYLEFISDFVIKFKNHSKLSVMLESDYTILKEKLEENEYKIINLITDNFLYCLEQISEHNTDYFVYQKEKIQKKNGKTYKNKLTKIGQKTLLKNILEECDTKSNDKLFSFIISLFNLFIKKDSESGNDDIFFTDEYINYIKENFTENKNYNKILMVIDNIDNILNINAFDEAQNEINIVNQEKIKENTLNKSKNGKKGKKGTSDGNPFEGFNTDFMKDLENTKIGQLAKNISSKINLEEYSDINDPMKLLSSLGKSFQNSSSNDSSKEESDGKGIQDLLKLVIGEVQGAFKDNKLEEKDLVDEAQNIIGQFQNMTGGTGGFDPMSMLKDGNFSMDKMAELFGNMQKK